MHMDIPGYAERLYDRDRGPWRTHLPTGGPNVTKTRDLLELRSSYSEDPGVPFARERELLQGLRSDDVLERRRATEVLLKTSYPGRPQRRSLLRFLESLYDEE